MVVFPEPSIVSALAPFETSPPMVRVFAELLVHVCGLPRAINELSDEGHAYLFGPRRKVIDAYKAWKAANDKFEFSEGSEAE